jgi:hypothetical protein
MRKVNRIPPAGPAGAYQTFQIASPSDRMVKVACRQAGCLDWRYGWDTVIDESDVTGQARAAYIRRESGRTFRELRRADGMTVFRFEPGQRCFSEHRTRPEFYSVRGGDWRANFGMIRRHTRPADWVEDFGEHQQRIIDQHERG